MKDLILMVNGELKPLPYLKVLAKKIYNGEIPKEWKKYIVPRNLDISMWIRDFSNRLK